MYAEWRRSWQGVKKTLTHEFFPTIDKAASMVIRSLPKQIQRMIVQILTGHSVLNGHMHKIHLADEPICRLCLEDDETPKHIILDCPAVDRERRLTLLPYLDQNTYSPTKNLILGIISFLATQSVAELFEVVNPSSLSVT